MTPGALVRSARNRHVDVWRDVRADNGSFKMGARAGFMSKESLAIVVANIRGTHSPEGAALLLVSGRFVWTFAGWLVVVT